VYLRGLVDVAESDIVVEESANRIIMQPTAMAHFRNQRVGRECAAQFDQELAVLSSESEGPGELHQHASKAASPLHWAHAFGELLDRITVKLAVFRKASVQSHTKPESGIAVDLAYPDVDDFRFEHHIAGGRDFDGVEIGCEVLEGMNAGPGAARLLVPATGAEQNGGVHSSPFLRHEQNRRTRGECQQFSCAE
jgi:hypothetical protein